MARTFAALAAFSIALVACATLPDIPAGQCGNGVIEAGEDCDTLGDPGGAACLGPGADGACHFDCQSAPCPAGYGCGADGICRAASGTFTSERVTLDEGATTLQVADFDGDGADDLVTTGTRGISVRYFDGALGLAKSTTLDLPLVVPGIGQLTDGDARADLVVPDSFGFGIWRGQADRSLANTVYPRFPVGQGELKIVLADAVHWLYTANSTGSRVFRAPSPGKEPLLFVDEPGLGGAALAVGDSVVLSAPQRPLAMLAPEIAVGTVDTSTLEPCEQIAYAFRDERKVHLVTPCADYAVPLQPPPAAPTLVTLLNAQPGGAQGTTIPIRELPPVQLGALGGPATRGVKFADIDGDGRQDLVVGGDAVVWVAYGRGDGTFDSKPVPATPPPWPVADQTARIFTPFEVFPLALGDLNGDGIPDAADETGLLVSQSRVVDYNAGTIELTYSRFYRSLGWSSAKIGDFDRNGRNDLLVTSQLGVELWSGAGETVPGQAPPFNVTLYGTSFPAEHLALGDIDGDGIDDLAYSERADDVRTGGHPVYIAWGRANAPFETPISVGRFDRVTALHLGVVSGISLSPRASVLIDSVEAGSADHTITILESSTRRLISAPFPLNHTYARNPRADGEPPTNEQAPASALRVAVGQFSSDPHQDVFALARFFSAEDPVDGKRIGPAVLVCESREQAALDPNAVLEIDASLLGELAFERAGLAVVDLNPPADPMAARDEVVILAPSNRDVGGAGALRVVRFDDNVAKIDAPITIGGGTSAVWHLGVGDVSGNGKNDLIGFYQSSDGGPTEARVFWNRGDGTLDPSGPVLMAPEGRALFAALAMQLDSTPPFEIVLLTGDGLFVARLGADGASFVVDPEPLRDSEGATIVGGRAAAVGDYDGDGVADLAIGSSGSVRIYRGIPRGERAPR